MPGRVRYIASDGTEGIREEEYEEWPVAEVSAAADGAAGLGGPLTSSSEPAGASERASPVESDARGTFDGVFEKENFSGFGLKETSRVLGTQRRCLLVFSRVCLLHTYAVAASQLVTVETPVACGVPQSRSDVHSWNRRAAVRLSPRVRRQRDAGIEVWWLHTCEGCS